VVGKKNELRNGPQEKESGKKNRKTRVNREKPAVAFKKVSGKGGGKKSEGVGGKKR